MSARDGDRTIGAQGASYFWTGKSLFYRMPWAIAQTKLTLAR
ncbi:hypothetical protein [Microcoleus sp.]